MEKNDLGCAMPSAAARGLAVLPLALVTVVFATAAFGETYTWDSANPATSFGGGAVTATLDGSSVSTLSKNTPDDVRIEGDSMSFAAGAEVALGAGTLTFALPMTAAGAISLGADAAILAYDGQPLSGVSNIVVFAGKDLSEWTPSWCDFNKNNWPGCTFGLSGRGTPYHVTRGEGTLDVQFQQLDGSLVKSVKVRFTQQGSDIVAKILHTLYVEDQSALGADFDTLEGALSYRVAIDNIGAHGYDMDYIVMRPAGVDFASVVVVDALTAAGTVTDAPGADLIFSGDAAGSADGSIPCAFYVYNTLGFKNRKTERFNISGAISGATGGTLSFLPWDAAIPVIPGDTLSHTGNYTSGNYQYINSSWETIAEIAGFNMESITNVTGRIHGPNVSLDNSPHVYFVSNSVNGLTRFYQFQTHDGWFKTIDVEINYAEPTLRVRVPRA